LQRQANPQDPDGEVAARHAIRSDSHVNVCRKDCQQQRHKAPPGGASKRPDQQRESTDDFTDSADSDERHGRGKHRRHDLLVETWTQQVIGASANEPYRRHNAHE